MCCRRGKKRRTRSLAEFCPCPNLSIPIPFVIQPPAELAARNPELLRWSRQLSQKYASRQVVTDDELKGIGGALWEALGAQEAFEAAHKAAGTAILPIIIESEAAEIQALPWEILHHPQLGFLGRELAFTLTRRIAPPAGSPPPLQKGPLRVLLFTSLPEDVHPERGRLDVEEEQAQVQAALLPWIAKGLVTLEIPDDGRFETLKDLLRDFDPHVVFLSGHGRFYGEAHSEEKFGALIFEDEAGNSREVREEALAEAFAGTNVQAVVLSACESGRSASDLLNNGLTSRLSAYGIPHVIGMRESVLDQAGIRFARALCDELARAERVDAALQAARRPIQTLSPATSAAAAEQWCLPILFSPRPQSPLIDWDFTPPQAEIEKRQHALSKFSLPPRFIGRRRELRQTKHRLLTGALTRLFISGAGGHGKTTLARKLASELEARGYRFFEWRADSPWRDFQQTLELALKDERDKTYDRLAIRLQDQPAALAQKCFELLNEQYAGKLALLFDNVEAIQDDKTFRLKDETAQVWLNAALSEKTNFVVLATSRWRLAEWNGEHLPLGGMNYGDFLRLAQALAERGQMNPRLLGERERLKQVYEALGHNPRGLEWFTAATLTMNPQEEEAFAEALARAQAELRQNMALEETLRRLPPPAFALLRPLACVRSARPRQGHPQTGVGCAQFRAGRPASVLPARGDRKQRLRRPRISN